MSAAAPPSAMSAAAATLGHVVVIGGNGFLGHHIVAQALDSTRWSASAVTSLDMRCDRNRSSDARAAYHTCDITDAAALAALLARLQPDVVVHTASPLAAGQTPDLYRRVNVDGTRAVIDACRHARVKALVYTSSASVISDNRSDLRNADERWPVIRGEQQHEYYSETKAAAEQLVLEANRSPHAAAPSSSAPPSSSSLSRNLLLTAAIRPAGIFGEGDVQTLAGFLNVLSTRRTNIQLGDNTNIFDFTYVGNVAHAHLLAAHALLTTAAAHTQPLDHEKVDGDVFFITNDSPCYFWDFARAIWHAAATASPASSSSSSSPSSSSSAIKSSPSSASSSFSASPYPSPVPLSRVWVISSSLGRTLGFLSEVVFSILGKPPTFTRQRAVMSTMTRYYNITKAKTVLRYKPLWSLSEGVDRGVTWFLEHQSHSQHAKS